jgi:hypothetical protein
MRKKHPAGETSASTGRLAVSKRAKFLERQKKKKSRINGVEAPTTVAEAVKSTVGPAKAAPPKPAHLLFCMTCDKLIPAEKMERHAPLGHDTVKIADRTALTGGGPSSTSDQGPGVAAGEQKRQSSSSKPLQQPAAQQKQVSTQQHVFTQRPERPVLPIGLAR